MSDDSWRVFHIEDLKDALSDAPVQYREFHRVATLSCGIYRLSAGSRDMQTPHDEDEIYYVLEGKASLRVGDTAHDITPGTVLFVQATEEHSFFEIEEDMTLLVFFARGARSARD